MTTKSPVVKHSRHMRRAGDNDYSSSDEEDRHLRGKRRKNNNLRYLFQNLTFFPSDDVTDCDNESVDGGQNRNHNPLRIPSSLHIDAEKSSQRESSISKEDAQKNEDDISHALNMGKLMLEDPDENSENEESKEGDHCASNKKILEENEILQRLASSLRIQLDLGDIKSARENDMFEEMARVMLKCRIKDSMDGVSKAKSGSTTVSQPSSTKNNTYVGCPKSAFADMDGIPKSECKNEDAEVDVKTCIESTSASEKAVENTSRKVDELPRSNHTNNVVENKENMPTSILKEDRASSTSSNHRSSIPPVSPHFPSSISPVLKNESFAQSATKPYVKLTSPSNTEVQRPKKAPSKAASNTFPPVNEGKADCFTPTKQVPQSTSSSPELERFHTPNAKTSHASGREYSEKDVVDINDDCDDELPSMTTLPSPLSFLQANSKDCHASRFAINDKSNEDESSDESFLFVKSNNSKNKNIDVSSAMNNGQKDENKENPFVVNFQNPPKFVDPPKTGTKGGKMRRKISRSKTPHQLKQPPPFNFGHPAESSTTSAFPNHVQSPLSKTPFLFSSNGTSNTLDPFQVDLSRNAKKDGFFSNGRKKISRGQRKGNAPSKNSVPEQSGAKVDATTIFGEQNTQQQAHVVQQHEIPQQQTSARPTFPIPPVPPVFIPPKSSGFVNNSTDSLPSPMSIFDGGRASPMKKNNVFSNESEPPKASQTSSQLGARIAAESRQAAEKLIAEQMKSMGGFSFSIGTAESTIDRKAKSPALRRKTGSGFSAGRVQRQNSMNKNTFNSPQQKASHFFPNNCTNTGNNVDAKAARSDIEKPMKLNSSEPPMVNGNSSRAGVPEKSSSKPTLDYSGLNGRIMALRAEGRQHYTSKNYVASVHCYTSAISALESNALSSSAKDVLAILRGNRSAALIMVGAYATAALDSKMALRYNVGKDNIELTPESGIVSRSKLTCRMGRAYLKCGETKKALEAFDDSIKVSEEVLEQYAQKPVTDHTRQGVNILKQTLVDAKLAKGDIKRYLDSINGANSAQRAAQESTITRNYHQVLMYLNNALTIAPGCKELHVRKAKLLIDMEEWSDVAIHCEKYACSMVKQDGLFIGDLKELNNEGWLFEIGAAKFLKTNHFEKKDGKYECLSVNAVAEAVVRLPRAMLPFYLRALRLEERYEDASKAGSALEAYIAGGLVQSGNTVADKRQFTWLVKERDKLRRTLISKEKGDSFFKDGHYERAAAKYATCLTIDAESELVGVNENAGGKLHAVLHCNRAACFMAIQKYRDAVKECTSALRIANRYMKAILRRARCYARMQMYQEASGDYQKWINFVEEARKAKSSQGSINHSSCYFDKASDVSELERERISRELDDVKRAMQDAMKNAQEEADRRAEREKKFRGNYFNSSSSSNRKQRYNRSNRNEHEWWKNPGGEQKYKRSSSNNRGSYSHRNSSRKQYEQKSSSRSRSYGSRNRSDENSKSDLGSPGSDMSKCHYQVLNIARSSSAADIKKSYRKMALTYHPDKNKDPTAADIFRRVKLAYEVLIDENSRKAYDMEARIRRSYGL